MTDIERRVRVIEQRTCSHGWTLLKVSRADTSKCMMAPNSGAPVHTGCASRKVYGEAEPGTAIKARGKLPSGKGLTSQYQVKRETELQPNPWRRGRTSFFISHAGDMHE